MKIGIAQFDPTVGAVEKNTTFLIESIDKFDALGVDLIVTPELYLLGYPPADLVLETSLQDRIECSLERLRTATETTRVGMIVGAPWKSDGRRKYNSVFLISDGTIHYRWDKQLLPFYDVFCDPRLFVSGPPSAVIEWRGIRMGVLICEDAWADMYPNDYSVNPITQLADQGPDIVLIPTASPFEINKTHRRTSVLARLAQRTDCPVVMVNQVGAQDGVVYAGSSAAFDRHGQLIHQVPEFASGCFVVDLTANPVELRLPDDCAQMAMAIETAISGYMHKSGFKQCVIGLSGGIDSAVLSSLASRALGEHKVIGVSLPSQYTSSESIRDAKSLANGLGIEYRQISIDPLYSQCVNSLGWTGNPHSLAMENIQSRIRGTLLMSIANSRNALVLSTGNKSELAMGYCTLYGDLIGAIAPLSDVYKSDIFRLASWINAHGGCIPQFTITRAPTAELRPNQTDQDTLPPYATLDAILKHRIEDGLSINDIVSLGYESGLVESVVTALNRNEFKREQAPMGVKLSRKAFGSGRRIPILSRGVEIGDGDGK